MKQIITPNPNVPCTPKLCLVYVQDGFGDNPYIKVPTAIEAWETNPTQHKDQDWPELWFPVFFEVSDDERGHVAIIAPDHSIYSSSSSTSHKPVHHPSLGEMEAYWNGRLTYLGWTESLEGVQLIEGDNMDADNYTVQALAEGGLGRTAEGDKNLLNNIGQPVNQVIDTFRSYPEWKARQSKAETYDADVKAAYEKGLAEAGGKYEQVTVYRKV